MSIAFAVLAGALAMLNPCGFVLLPAFLSLYTDTDTEASDLPRTSTRTLQAILAGLTVTAGALSIFTAVGVPIALGAGQLAAAIPWVGLALGVGMAAVAVITLAGNRIPLPERGVRVHRRHGTRGMLLFGVGYGVASLGCTLPIFLVVIGAALITDGGLAALTVFGGYALGMAVVLMALAISAALLRDGIARTLTRVLPHMRWINGGLLLLVSAYLLYYWGAVQFASVTSRAHDPVIGFTQRFTTQVQSWANTGAGRWLLIGAASIVAAALLRVLWQWARTDPAPDHNDTETGEQVTPPPSPRRSRT